MIMVNINEVKAKLSEYLDKVAAGDRVMICKRNQPVAELTAVEQKRTEPRPIGGGPHSFDVPDAFFEPMPDEWLDEFYNGPIFPEEPKVSKVSESAPAYGSAPRRRRRK
jgi:prevent-host-death family protein